ncbi:MAG: dTDP-4-dehydrorhamnose 3,5-epimerase [Bacteroidota bacterium]
MIIEETLIPGAYLIKPKVFEDERGYFLESYNEKLFKEKTGLKVNFVQDNQSLSQYGVLRGLHFQYGPYAQAKLVQVIQGKVLDVIVDIRKESSTYGKHFSIVLDSQSKTQLFAPRGVAHGFVTLENDTIFFYKCDNFYNKENEGGLLYSDPELSIDWGLKPEELIISEKDKINPSLNALKTSLSL